MSLASIAAVADLLAALGVIASLLFLSWQIRQNTRALGNQNWLAIVERIAEQSTRTLNRDVAETVSRGSADYEKLEEPERIVFDAWAYEFMICVNRHIGFEEQGLRPEIAAMTERYLNWFFAQPGNRAWWRYPDRRPFPEHYERVIDRYLEGLPKP